MLKSIYYFTFCFLFIGCANSNADISEPANEADTLKNIELTIEPNLKQPEVVNFPSLDSLTIYGMLYEVNSEAPVILLCHQAGYNLHEYDEIAPKLNEMGYTCLAIDQRAGGLLDGYVNQTADGAIDRNLPVEYINAEQDILAAIDFCYERYGKQIILWGSSYSSALALHIGANNDKLKAIISFSPGDYFGAAKPPLETIMPAYSLPFFITSSKREAEAITKFLSKTSIDANHTQFIPKKEGKHGSKALWNSYAANAEYWSALKKFLSEL